MYYIIIQINFYQNKFRNKSLLLICFHKFQNESKRKWIRRLAWKSSDNEFLKRVPLLLGEIKENPIGMGKGQFLINESFLYRVNPYFILPFYLEKAINEVEFGTICVFSFSAGLDLFLFFKHNPEKQKPSNLQHFFVYILSTKNQIII